jgi:hypothetical protein
VIFVENSAHLKSPLVFHFVCLSRACPALALCND